jgi:hypothetical protein
MLISAVLGSTHAILPMHRCGNVHFFDACWLLISQINEMIVFYPTVYLTITMNFNSIPTCIIEYFQKDSVSSSHKIEKGNFISSTNYRRSPMQLLRLSYPHEHFLVMCVDAAVEPMVDAKFSILLLSSYGGGPVRWRMLSLTLLL